MSKLVNNTNNTEYFPFVTISLVLSQNKFKYLTNFYQRRKFSLKAQSTVECKI